MKRPNYFATVWVAGEWLYLELPAIGGLTAHNVRFPCTQNGLLAAIMSLRSRSETSTIGTEGDPTQHDVEKLIAEFKGKVKRPRSGGSATPEQRAKAKEVLRRLGMI